MSMNMPQRDINTRIPELLGHSSRTNSGRTPKLQLYRPRLYVFSVRCTVESLTELTEAKIQFVTTETNYLICIQDGNDYNTLYDRSNFDKNIFVCFKQ